MLDLGRGSPLMFLGDMKTPAVHTCPGSQVWSSRDGQGGANQTEGGRE